MTEMLERAIGAGDQPIARDGTNSQAALETRLQIVRTASDLFHVYGYQKTTVADIARELGMSPANVYRFFASKAELTKAVTTLVANEMRARMMDEGDADKSTGAGRLRAMVRRHFHHMRDRYTDNRKIHDLLEAAMEQAWDEIEVHKSKMRDVFAAVIRDGIESGEFAEQNAEASAMLFQHALVMFFHPALIAETCRCLPSGHHDLLFEPMVDFAIAAVREGGFKALPDELRQPLAI